MRISPKRPDSDARLPYNDFYVYGHYTADTDQLFYIGKGRKKRAWSTTKRNQHWHRIVKERGYTVKFFQEDMSNTDAYQLEASLIREVGIHNLTNTTNPDDWNVVNNGYRANLSEHQRLPRYKKWRGQHGVHEAILETKYNDMNKARQLARLFPTPSKPTTKRRIKPTPTIYVDGEHQEIDV